MSTDVLDRVLESSESKRQSLTDTGPLSSSASGADVRPLTLPNDSSLTDAQSVAKRALNRSAELLKDLDSFLMANERKTS